eukprot:gene2370-2675_t
MNWLQNCLIRAGDEVHVVVVALPVPYPILDESSAAVAALEAQQWRVSTEKSVEYARSLSAKVAVTLAGAASGAGLADVSTKSVALLPEGGASDVGASVCKYAQEHQRRLCRRHMRAPAVQRDGYGDQLWRFCFQCGKLEPIANFEGDKRTCTFRLHQRRRVQRNTSFSN